MTPQVLYIFGKGKISILKFWYRFGDFLAFRSLSTPFLRQNGLENHFFRIIANYIFLERYCYVEFRYWGIFYTFGHLVPNFGRRSPLFWSKWTWKSLFQNHNKLYIFGKVLLCRLKVWGYFWHFLDIWAHDGLFCIKMDLKIEIVKK